MRTLGVRYLVTAPSAAPAPGRLVHSGDARIYEFPESISRATRDWFEYLGEKANKNEE